MQQSVTCSSDLVMNKTVLEPRVSPAFAITYLCNHCNIRFDPIPVKVRKRSLTPRWPLTPRLLKSLVWLYPRIIVYKSHENTSKYVDTVTLFAKTWTKGHWPLDDIWSHICWGHMCDVWHKDHCVQVPWKYIKVGLYGFSDPFCKKLEPKVIDP